MLAKSSFLSITDKQKPKESIVVSAFTLIMDESKASRKFFASTSRPSRNSEWEKAGDDFDEKRSHAEEAVKKSMSPVPGNFDGVSHRALHAAGRRAVRFRNIRIQDLCDPVHDRRVFRSHDDSFSEILVSLEMRGNAKLTHQVGDPQFQCRDKQRT